MRPCEMTGYRVVERSLGATRIVRQDDGAERRVGAFVGFCLRFGSFEDGGEGGLEVGRRLSIDLLPADALEGLMHELGHVSEDSGAAGVEAAIGQLDEHVAQSGVDGCGGAEVADGAEDFRGEGFERSAFQSAELLPGVVMAEFRMIGGAEHAAAAAVRGAIGTPEFRGLGLDVGRGSRSGRWDRGRVNWLR